MNYPAASYGVSSGNDPNAPRGGELNPCPPQEGLSASGGLVRLRRACPPQADSNISLL